MNNEKMIIEEDDLLVRIFIGEREKANGIPLYEFIVLKCRELGMAGATASRGMMGYGADRRLHTSKLVDLSDNLPVIVEIVDTEDNIAKLKPYLDEVIQKGFVTIEKVHVIKYRSK